ncbi:DUF2079 domain-containing protein [Georgenia sp. 311]|uniref:DUF2079 domain-containing protein n=1 Tax=Georgenia sp. 311 TaxID=2585134 RepID=UPI0011126D78|nr:DUF2079 domain-containing protein [Georgenia sp. 311]TNC18249.1 DUF2079 domain-containing protein [Georgenia sp. 311]
MSPAGGVVGRTGGRLWQPWAVAGVAGVLYVVVGVLQWRRLEVPSWDLAIFTQLAKAYGSFSAPIVPIKGDGFNLLGDHFHPILVLLGPVYALFPSGLTLLVVQALLVAVSAWPLTALAVRRLGPVPGTVLGALYVLSYGIQGAVRTQFHEVAFALPLLAFGLCAFLERRWRAAALWLAPVVFVKEDLGLLVAVLGLVMWWRGARRAGPGLALWGAAWFALATAVILPALNPRGQYDYADRLTVGDVLGDPLGTLAAVLGPGEKVVTVLLLVAAAGVLGVRSPILLAALPTLAWRFLGDVPFYWTWGWHYDAVLMPLAVAAMLDALGPRPVDDAADPPPAVVHRRRTALALGAAGLGVLLTAPGLPVADLLHGETWRPSPRAEAARAVLDTVPDGATVASDIGLLARLVPTTTALWSGTPDNPAPDYYVIDQEGSTWGGSPPPDAAAHAELKHPGTDYEIVLDTGGYQVARRVDGG